MVTFTSAVTEAASNTLNPAANRHRRFWDGAIGGYNNPALAGIVEILARPNPPAPDTISVLSIGTGSVVLPWRGHYPTAHDRVLATRYGVYACDMVSRGEWGKMAALKGNEIVSVDLAEATRELKRVPDSFFEVAQVFFG